MHSPDNKKQILIIDRDVATVEPLRQKLSDAGFAVRVIADGTAALASIAERPPHLVIIDWNTPGFAALELIRILRRTRLPQAARLIILSALAGEQDIVAGLDLGADDYIAKPFSMREVVTRVRVLLRSRPIEALVASLSFGDLALDATTNRVTARGRLLALRGIEYRLLEFFMSHPGRTFNRGQLLAHVWGDDSDVDERTVDVNVQRLRKLLAEPGFEGFIQTVRGFGYRFSPPPAGPGPGTGERALVTN
jgi:two-component system phosphate regulon response regulator PhoB